MDVFAACSDGPYLILARHPSNCANGHGVSATPHPRKCTSLPPWPFPSPRPSQTARETGSALRATFTLIT
jgi:hypothetical protein